MKELICVWKIFKIDFKGIRTTPLFLYSLKTEKQRFSDVFRGYRKSGLIVVSFFYFEYIQHKFQDIYLQFTLTTLKKDLTTNYPVGENLFKVHSQKKA